MRSRAAVARDTQVIGEASTNAVVMAAPLRHAMPLLRRPKPSEVRLLDADTAKPLGSDLTRRVARHLVRPAVCVTLAGARGAQHATQNEPMVSRVVAAL